jgi:hypothetical protein
MPLIAVVPKLTPLLIGGFRKTDSLKLENRSGKKAE